MDDRRQFKRYTMSNESIEFAKFDDGVKHECRLKDLSERGARILCWNKIKEDEFIKLDVPQISGRPRISVNCKVVWQKPVNSMFSEVGLQFPDVSYDSSRYILDYIFYKLPIE